MTYAEDIARVRDWLVDPARDTGIHLADDADGWEYRSYAEIAEQSWAIAARMRERGFGAGDGACVLMPTGFPCFAAFYAVWACGGVFTPVAPPVFSDVDQIVAQLAGILEQAGARLVVTAPEFETFVCRAATAAGRADAVLVVDAETLGSAPAARELAEPGEVALLQFTSGSTGTPRGVRVSWANLANNIGMISALLDWRPGEAMVSWLPLYHDMGLVGTFLTTVTNQAELRIMRPDQFVRDPLRWLRAAAGAQHSMSPSFALGYVAHRLRPEDIAGLDLSGWRTLAVGAEPVEVADLQAFAELARPQGFSMNAYTLAYGLAEATLMVTASIPDRPIVALRIDNPALRFGRRVPVLEEARIDDARRVDGAGWITGLGTSTPECTVAVVDDEGRELPDGVLGEIVVTGDSVALGYSGASGAGSSTYFSGGRLYTGDAGFLYRGEVFVLGRMGASLKVRGRSVFMEDVESRIAQETGLTKGKLAAVGVTDAGERGIALFAEAAPGPWITEARKIIRANLGPAHTVHIVTGPRGLIRRTSSGKPRRRHMWQLLRDGVLDGALRHASELVHDGSAPLGLPEQRVRQLLESALEVVAVPSAAAVLFEGSLAEGFGNEGSDIDFLVVSPGSEELPTLPTVLFLDGRRVEVRTRSVAQLRRQLIEVAIAPTEDLLNRCQRFLRATVIREGAVDLAELRGVLTHDDLATIAADWWAGRAVQNLRFAVALRAFGARAESAEWALDGLQQAVKGWAARRGETYIETKWLPHQLDRIGAHDYVVRYRALTGARTVLDQARWEQVLMLAAELGAAVCDDPHQIVFTRRPRITTWAIGARVHVLRADREVFVLSDAAAAAWRSVVFRHSIRDVLARATREIGPALAEFVHLGLVGLQWRGAEAVEPALAMCKPPKPYTPVPSAAAPALGLAGGVPEDDIATLAPFSAATFAECGMNLVWANVVVENAREDLVGAIKSAQGAVADIAAHRLLAMGTRVVLTAFGVYPLPADVAPLSALARLVPARTPRRAELLATLEAAQRVRFPELFADGGEPLEALAVIDEFIGLARVVAGEPDAAQGFPASFDSREQWQRTLAIGYDWLRLAGYLNTDLPLDETRDLLASGGHQPHLRESEHS